jgi:hypothetical protein
MKLHEIGRLCGGISRQLVCHILKKRAPQLVRSETTPRVPPAEIEKIRDCFDRFLSVDETIRETGFSWKKIAYWRKRLLDGRSKSEDIDHRIMRHADRIRKIFGEKYPNGCKIGKAMEVFEQVCGKRFHETVVRRMLTKLELPAA